YRMMQGLPPNSAGLDQMQPLSATQQHPMQGMVPQQHQAAIQQPMGYMQPPQVAHNPAQAMMYGQPQPRKVAPQNDRMVLRSSTRTGAGGVPVSSTPVPTSTHPAQPQPYGKSSHDGITTNPAALNPYGGSR
ncbi:hypothetical protein GGI25_005977, partial [Coemansia spiralis]